jgi:probable blue pigment (indigoidine) exporter
MLRGRQTVVLLLGLLCLIWGSTWLVIREGLADLPPFTSAAVRFVISALCMVVLARRLSRREGGGSPGWRLSLIHGTMNVGINYAVVYWTEVRLPSGLVSLLWSVFPMMVAVLGHCTLPDERLVGRQWLGFAVGLMGIGVLFMTDLVAMGPEAVPAGLVLLSAPALSAVGQTYIKRHGRDVSSVLLNRNGFAVGAILLSVIALAVEGDEPVRWTPAAIGSVAYLSLMGTVLAFSIYFWLLRKAPAHQLSLIAYIVPAVAMFLGVVRLRMIS